MLGARVEVRVRVRFRIKCASYVQSLALLVPFDWYNCRAAAETAVVLGPSAFSNFLNVQCFFPSEGVDRRQ